MVYDFASAFSTRNWLQYINDLNKDGIIIRLHRSTTYVDAAYSYRQSSVVRRSVCRSV